jgi:hypothetical protein
LSPTKDHDSPSISVFGMTVPVSTVVRSDLQVRSKVDRHGWREKEEGRPGLRWLGDVDRLMLVLSLQLRDATRQPSSTCLLHRNLMAFVARCHRQCAAVVLAHL